MFSNNWFTNPLPYGLDYNKRPQDFWPTPAHCTKSLLDDYPPKNILKVTDPCAGDGAILRVLKDYGYSVNAIELRIEEKEGLEKICPTIIGDWLKIAWNFKPKVIITNPPFKIGIEIVSASLGTTAKYIAMLLRLDTLGSNNWSKIWLNNPPTAIRPLRKRPSFSGDKKTDFSNYGWFIWDKEKSDLDIKPI